MRFFIPLLIALLTITSVSAALNVSVVTHDTDVQSTYDYLKVCSCGGTTDMVRIKNIGQLEANYALIIDADQPWFTLEKNSLRLRPGQSADVAVYTNAPCGAVGIGHYKVYVSSEYGRYRAIDKTIQTGVCENILADITPDATTVEPCGSQVFDLTLTNSGTFSEKYAIESGKLAFPSVTLSEGETRTIKGVYNATCDEYGTTTIPVTISSERNGLKSTQPITVTVPRNYDYSVEFDDVPRPICAQVTNTIPVIVTNNEVRANTIEISGNPASSTESVYLLGSQTQIVDLPFTPTKAGSARFTISASGLNGTIEKKAQVDLPVEACYGFTLQSPLEVTACPGQLTIPFTIVSVGTQVQNLEYDIQSNISTTSQGLSDRLKPSQEIDKTVSMIVPDADREYYVTLVANNSYSTSSQTTTINAYSTETCYKVAPSAHQFRVWTDQKSVPVLIKQTGIQPGVYSVKYDSNFMSVREKTITLAPGEETVLHFDVNADGFAPGRYVDRLTLSSHGVDYTTDFEIRLAEKGFFEKLIDAWHWSGEFLFCSILTIIAALLLLFVLIVTIGIILGLIHYKNPKSWSKGKIALISSVIIIILLLLLITAVPRSYPAYERPLAQSNHSALFYEIGEGQEIVLNVATLFKDPDNDTLSFSATPSKNLLVKIEKNVATIKAAHGFRGEDTIIFTANDRRGGVSDSDAIRVSVVPYKQIGFLDYWLANCWFMTLLLLLIAVVIFTLVMLFTKGHHEDSEVKKKIVHHRSKNETDLEMLAPSEIGRDLTPLEKDVLRQAHQLVKAENLMQAENITINQNTTEELWVGSEDGKRFHKITCPLVKNMPKEKRVTWNSREEAIKAGYTPCKTCSVHE